MGAVKDRAVHVIRGSPTKSSTVQLLREEPLAGEFLVQVQAAALTPTDVLLCSGSAVPLLGGTTSATPFVPGLFFCGQVLSSGPFTEGLEVGEPVLGVTSAPAAIGGGLPEESSQALASKGGGSTSSVDLGGCYRETVRVHFSSILPVAALVEAKLQLPAVVAHLAPMVSALMCVASHLRPRPSEALLIVAPRLCDVAFVLQRLLLISDAWRGPLYLLVLHGHAPSRADLERHPLIRPLLAAVTRGETKGGALGAGTFLEDLVGFSVEEHAKQSLGKAPTPEQMAVSLRELVARVFAATGGSGLDAVLALDVDLGPEERLSADAAQGDLDAACAALETSQRPPTLLRTLLGALALRGRLVTNCRRLEMTPADGEHLWTKECSLSFLNPHCLPLSAARHGALLHAVAEVCGRLAAGELAMVDSEVVQYRMFEQFQQALDAMDASGSGRAAKAPGAGGSPGWPSGTGCQLVSLLV
ncbi:unnamed protein product [Polarella glacialis]|uniref:Alcohol dehydrogenase-like N-terminal domain-containing protein n=1 Tax=Polarella glacialis TaxID=89957 RepID=A0A813G654_POLGL|nr:unnamed protein product [Polarella glacialis]